MDDRRHFRPLDESGRLRLDEGACLPLRSRFGQCRACESACPVGVISVSVERVALAPGCLGCGRCVAACPNEALHCDGFESLEQPRVAEAPIELECARVPAASRTAAAVVVPCLGGVSAGRLAQLHAKAGRGGLCVIDRGWCGQCAAGSANRHPAAAAIEALRLWLDAIPDTSSDPVPAPALVARALPLSQAASAAAPPTAPAQEAPTPRRQFLRTLVGRAPEAKPVPMGADGRAAFPARERRPSPERRRLLEALEATARRRGSALPAELFPRLFGTGACVDHRVCTAACPTGALRVQSTDTESALHFDAAVCIGCGACTRACPEGALKLDGGGGPLRAVLATHLRQTCESCGETFTPRGTEAVCLACSKSQRLLADVLFHRQATTG